VPDPIVVVDATTPEAARAELVRQVVDLVLQRHGAEAFVHQAEYCLKAVAARLRACDQLTTTALLSLGSADGPARYRVLVTEAITELCTRRPPDGPVEIHGVVLLPREVAHG
jgi:hypothetical protein